jgi:hypothetical protein
LAESGKTGAVSRLFELAEEVEKKGEEDADDDAGGDGKIETEVPAFDRNVAGKPAEPKSGENIRIGEQETRRQKNDPKKNQSASHKLKRGQISLENP